MTDYHSEVSDTSLDNLIDVLYSYAFLLYMYPLNDGT